MNQRLRETLERLYGPAPVVEPPNPDSAAARILSRPIQEDEQDEPGPTAYAAATGLMADPSNDSRFGATTHAPGVVAHTADAEQQAEAVRFEQKPPAAATVGDANLLTSADSGKTGFGH